MLHPLQVGRPLAALENALQVNLRAARSIVGSLSGDRIIQYDGICHAQYVISRGQFAHRVAYRWRDLADQDAVIVSQFNVRTAFGLPRQEPLEEPSAFLEVLLGAFDLVPAVHRAADDALEDHDFARSRGGYCRAHEILPDIGN
ncbi:MAG TPA: hypothetical protein VKE24_15510 [Candidatus Acidoferrales bacterium]|nr:hypothetical protein [Candidatus Acidoferrales bacterium]